MKKPFSLEKHREVGAFIYRLRYDLMKLGSDIEESYGSSSRAARMRRQTQKYLEYLRSELDNRVCSENERLPDMEKVYYPGTRFPEEL